MTYYCMLIWYNLISKIGKLDVFVVWIHLTALSYKFEMFSFFILLSVPTIFVLFLWHPRLSKTDRSKVMDEKEATDEYVATAEEEVSSFLPHFIQKSMFSEDFIQSTTAIVPF